VRYKPMTNRKEMAAATIEIDTLER